MPIPAEILSVERPKNTRVKKSGDHYYVIKRTCVYKDGRNVPKELGTIGEIIDGKYIEKRKEPRKYQCDIKDYGEIALCNSVSGDLLQEIARHFDIRDAEKLYVIALLRACYGDIKNRDLEVQYETSFASEFYPGVSLSENTVSRFLEGIGKAYGQIRAFMAESSTMSFLN